jgi:hydrogenase nickel incorporation protein HypB
MSVRVIDVRERVMARNDELAAEVRGRLQAAGVFALNLVSSPGSGKTTLLERTLEALGTELAIATVTGDVQTVNDADRLARHTSRLVQAVVTSGACHLDARQVARALDAIDLDDTDLLFVENVGNLVCPSSYDLGEDLRVVLHAVTEGEDKPLKYPTIFNSADLAIVTKIDLSAAVGFDREEAHRNIRAVRPQAEILETSARTGEGMDGWLRLLVEGRRSRSVH